MSIDRAATDLMELERRADQLRAELAATEDRIGKLRIFMEMARSYGIVGADQTVGDVPPTHEARARSVGGRPQGGMKETVIPKLQAILRERKQPMHTRDMVAWLFQQGIEIGGETLLHKQNNLSGMLSRAKGIFTNDRASGWGLVEWERQDSTSSLQPVLPTQD